jgi:F-type H+-transporting ATPase subunit delta
VKVENIAQSYAQAIYESVMEQWIASLRQARDGMTAKPQLAFDLTAPGLSPDERRALLQTVLPEGIAPEIENWLLLLAQKGHLNLLDDIADEFEELAVSKAHRVLARVTTAVPMTDDEKAALRQKLQAELETELEFDFVVDPAILGGVIVSAGGRVIDDSVAGKLTALRETLGVSRP